MKNTARPEAGPLRTIAAKSNLNGILPVIPRKDVTHVVIKSEDEAYFPLRRDVRVEQGRMVEVRIELTPLSQEKEKATSVFHPIYFDPGSDRIKVDFYPHLYGIVEHLRSNPDVKLRIVGYSDLAGSPGENRLRPEEGECAVRDYFRKDGGLMYAISRQQAWVKRIHLPLIPGNEDAHEIRAAAWSFRSGSDGAQRPQNPLPWESPCPGLDAFLLGAGSLRRSAASIQSPWCS
jgi:outer membrane protein OmpA-like peptidoglycan-associated protein